MKHGFGIIGLGKIAELHAKAIRDIPDAELVACFDINIQTVRQFSNTYGGRSYSLLDDFLADPQLDIVSICTPSSLHMESAVAAAQAGKHIIVEKPLEITVERCDSIIAAARERQVIVSGIFPARFYGAAQVVKKAIDENRLGQIVLGDAYVKWFRSQAYYDSSDWKGTWKYDGGGALMNQSIHAIDLLQWFMGPVTQVSAYTGTLAHESIEVEDTAVAILRFANGSLGVIEGTTGAFPGFYKRIELSGSNGSIILEEENLTTWKFVKEQSSDEQIRQDFAALTATGGGASDPDAISYYGHKMQFIDVIRAIESDGTPLIDGLEARKAVEIIQAIYTSAETGVTVSLPLI